MEVDPAKSGSDQTTNEHSDCKLKDLPCLATADFDTLSSDVQMSDADSDDNLMELDQEVILATQEEARGGNVLPIIRWTMDVNVDNMETDFNSAYEASKTARDRNLWNQDLLNYVGCGLNVKSRPSSAMDISDGDV